MTGKFDCLLKSFLYHDVWQLSTKISRFKSCSPFILGYATKSILIGSLNARMQIEMWLYSVTRCKNWKWIWHSQRSYRYFIIVKKSNSQLIGLRIQSGWIQTISRLKEITNSKKKFLAFLRYYKHWESKLISLSCLVNSIWIFGFIYYSWKNILRKKKQ